MASTWFRRYAFRVQNQKLFVRTTWSLHNRKCIFLRKASPMFFHSSSCFAKGNKDALVPAEEELALKERLFKRIEHKDKSAFLRIVTTYSSGTKIPRGHVEFIYAALRCMEEFDVQCDLESYKKLMDVFPKGKMIAQNMIQAEFFHYGRHQDCGIELLDEMEWNAVLPDKEMKELVLNIFGKSSEVFKKLGRMLYWMPKLKNLNPYAVPDPLPSDIEQLAELVLRKMSVDKKTKFSHFKAADLEDSVDDTWIVSAQSPVQQKLLQNHPTDKPVYVQGGFLVWLRKLSLSYFILRAEPPPKPDVEYDDDDVSNISLYMFGEPKPKGLQLAQASVHEQEDNTILGMCATGTSSKDSVLSWIRCLQAENPALDKIPVLFTLRSPPTALTTVNVSGKAEYADDGHNEEVRGEEKASEEKPSEEKPSEEKPSEEKPSETEHKHSQREETAAKESRQMR